MYESGELIEFFNTNGINVQLATPNNSLAENALGRPGRLPVILVTVCRPTDPFLGRYVIL